MVCRSFCYWRLTKLRIVIRDRKFWSSQNFNFTAKTGRRQKYHRGIIMFQFLSRIVCVDDLAYSYSFGRWCCMASLKRLWSQRQPSRTWVRAPNSSFYVSRCDRFREFLEGWLSGSLDCTAEQSSDDGCRVNNLSSLTSSAELSWDVFALRSCLRNQSCQVWWFLLWSDCPLDECVCVLASS